MAIEEGTTRPIYFNKELSVGEKEELVKLLLEYRDVFAWNYSEMPGIDKELVEHRLNINRGAKLVNICDVLPSP